VAETDGRGNIRTFEGPDYGAFFDIVFIEDGNTLTVGATNHVHIPPYLGDALLMKLILYRRRGRGLAVAPPGAIHAHGAGSEASSAAGGVGD
jgi:hypothetical protein